MAEAGSNSAGAAKRWPMAKVAVPLASTVTQQTGCLAGCSPMEVMVQKMVEQTPYTWLASSGAPSGKTAA